MTNTSPLALRTIFELDGASLEEQWKSVASGACLQAIQERILSRAAAALTPGFWKDATIQLVQAAQSLLDTPLDKVLATAWVARKELRKYADPSAYPPGDEGIIELHEHEVESKHEGKVTVLLNEKEVGTLDLTLTLTVHITAGVLTISAGRLMTLQSVRGTVVGTLQCGGVTIFEKKTSSLEPFKTISFGEGIPIPFAGGEEDTLRRVVAPYTAPLPGSERPATR